MLVNYDFSSDEEKDVIKKEIKTLNRNDKEEKNQKIQFLTKDKEIIQEKESRIKILPNLNGKRKEPEEMKKKIECPVIDKYIRVEEDSDEMIKMSHFLPPQIKNKKGNISII